MPTQSAAEGAANAPGVLFILDASGSMRARIDNREKMVIAKEVMTNLLRDLPDTIKVGLEVYGHHSKGDCNDIEVMTPIGQADKATLIQRIQAIDPKGMTPITQSLQVAAEQLKTVEQETTVVLVSDGEETCKGDPCAVVGSLLQQGIKLKIHVIGFDVGGKEKQQLMCIAKAGNGKYFAANNAEQLKSALTEVKQEVVKKVEALPKKPEATTSQKVIKVQRPAIGMIEIKNNMTGFVEILDQKTGEAKARFCNGCGSNTQLLAGIYKLKFPNFTIEGIELGDGEKKIIGNYSDPLLIINCPQSTSYLLLTEFWIY
ncbi:MAG: VWA domain-containing protein [Candidatus Competibacteraceae bacterium]|nr:VWA domain-containing protein [Candidatus Competibacteraceae bacterium]